MGHEMCKSCGGTGEIDAPPPRNGREICVDCQSVRKEYLVTILRRVFARLLMPQSR